MEEATAIFVIISSMALMGSMVSRMVAMMNQLNAMVAERRRTQRQVQRYLVVNKIPAELSVRIQRCVEHGLEARTKLVAKPAQLSMLPQKLTAELTMAQVGYNFQFHPFFNLIIQAKLSVLSELWGAFKPAFYEIGDFVFIASSAARGMHFTSSGVYRLQFGIVHAPDLEMHQDFSMPQWFAEASLFTSMTHVSTLTARSFGEVFLLTGHAFADAMSSSPIGIVAVFEYAQAFLRAVRHHCESDVGLTGLDLLPGTFSTDATQATELAEVVTSQAQADGGGGMSPSKEPMRRVASCIQTAPRDTPLGFIQKVMHGSLDDAAIRAELEDLFPEVHSLGGTYKRAGLQDERERAVLSMMSAFWLIRDQYEPMVAGQHAKKKLTEETWTSLQHAIRWVDLDEDMTQAALVFLAIRGLGKARRFSRMCPPGPLRRHSELAVAFAMRELPLVVPSVGGLSAYQFDLVKTSLELTVDFSLQQMLQGETSPVSIHRLQRAAEDVGSQGVKFYLFVQVCMMCGSEVKWDSEGCPFLTEANARVLVTGLECLRQFEQEEARKLYWTYVSTRARMLDVASVGPEDLAFARLICLTDANDQEKLKAVRQAWSCLGSPERKILVEWFLRDGMADSTFTFKFLPQYLANAKSNRAVGILEALMVLLDFIERLLECGCMDSGSNVIVDMSDLAVIVKEVRMPRGLTKAVEVAKIVYQQDKAAIVMTSRSWRLATALSTFKQRISWDDVVQNQEGDDLDTSRLQSSRQSVCSAMGTSPQVSSASPAQFAV
ncbi:unnamed protein product [Prorocentrum cordatum]|uniref:Uncharacterized protein n=1 Tax=Prorocentrum cordatum TaxID=2364126 RepID=A0ABN9PA62_9DINO|nr:unnamed protein product [Polarella glacialis]